MANDTVSISLKLVTKEFQKGISDATAASKRFGDHLRNQRDTFKRTAQIGAVAFGAISAGIAATVIPAKRLEDGIANAMSLIDPATKGFAEMKASMTKDAIALSKELGISASDVADGFYNVLSTGAEAGTEGFKTLAKTAIKLGKTVGLTTAESVETLSDAIGAYGLELTDATRVADLFFNASKKVAVTVPQLRESFKLAAPVAAAASISIEKTAAILDKFAEAGLKGSLAGTSFTQILNSFTKQTEASKLGLSILNTEVFDSSGNLRDLTDIFRDLKSGLESTTEEQGLFALSQLAGAEASGKLALLLRGNVDEIDDFAEEFKKSGALTDGFNTKMKTLSGQLAIAKASFEAVIIPIGTAFIPLLVKAAQKVATLTEKMSPWIEQNAKLLTVLIGGGAAGAGLLASIGTFGLMLSGLPALLALVTNPIGLITLGVLALAGAIAFFVLKGKELPTTMAGVDDAINKNRIELFKLERRFNQMTREGESFEDMQERVAKANFMNGKSVADLKEKYDKLSEEQKTLMETKEELTEVEKREAAARELANKATATAVKLNTELVGPMPQMLTFMQGIAQRVQERAIAQHKLNEFEKEFLRDVAPNMLSWLREIEPGFDIIQDKIEETGIRMGDQVPMWEMWTNSMGNAIRDNLAFGFIDGFAIALEAEKNFGKAFVKGMGAVFLFTLQSAIQMSVAEIIAFKIKEMWKAGIGSFMNPGNLIKIPLIAAAGAAAVSALRGLEGKLFKQPTLSFEGGGVIPFTGPHMMHKGEIVFNPEKNDAADLANFAGGGGGVGFQMFQSNFYGSMHNDVDVRKAGKIIGEQLARRIGPRGPR